MSQRIDRQATGAEDSVQEKQLIEEYCNLNLETQSKEQEVILQKIIKSLSSTISYDSTRKALNDFEKYKNDIIQKEISTKKDKMKIEKENAIASATTSENLKVYNVPPIKMADKDEVSPELSKDQKAIYVPPVAHSLNVLKSINQTAPAGTAERIFELQKQSNKNNHYIKRGHCKSKWVSQSEGDSIHSASDFDQSDYDLRYADDQGSSILSDSNDNDFEDSQAVGEDNDKEKIVSEVKEQIESEAIKYENFLILKESLIKRYEDNYNKMLKAAKQQMKYLLGQYNEALADFGADSLPPPDGRKITTRQDIIARLINGEEIQNLTTSENMAPFVEPIKAVSRVLKELNMKRGDQEDNLDYYRNRVVAAHTSLTITRVIKDKSDLEIIKQNPSPTTSYFENVFYGVAIALSLGIAAIVFAKDSKERRGHYKFWKPAEYDLRKSIKETENALKISRP
jgi:hypothetical protein